MATYFLHTGVLDALRVRRGLSLQALAIDSQVSLSIVTRMCRGDREYVDDKSLRRLAKALDVDISLLADVSNGELAAQR